MTEYQRFGNSYYSPAFFRMKIDGPYDLHDFNEIPNAGLAFYLHEYIHFIQDISTVYGLMNIHNTVYYIQDTASRIGKQSETSFPVPYLLPDDKDDQGYFNHQIMREYRGSPIQPFRKKINVKDVEEIYISHANHRVPFIQITAEDLSEGSEFKFVLGGNHITEGMAFLSEQYVYADLLALEGIVLPTSDYPYNVVSKLVDRFYPEMSFNIPAIIATCDASLMTYNPGLSFLRCLKHLKAINFLNNDFVASALYTELATLLREGHVSLKKVSDTARDLLLKNFKVEHFEGNNIWINLIFDRALKIREDYPDFLIDILKPGDLKKNNDFVALRAFLGSPMVINSEYEGTFSLPHRFNSEKLHLSLFWAINQILRIFTNNKPLPCEMKSHCERSQLDGGDVVVDERCDIAPWSRCVDEKLCPVGAMWKHWSLGKFEPNLRITQKNDANEDQ